MKRAIVGIVVAGAGLVASAGAVNAGRYNHGAPECNWGKVISAAIAEGSDRGDVLVADLAQSRLSPQGEGARPGLANYETPAELDETCQVVNES